MDIRPLRAYRRISEQLSELEHAEMLAREHARFELAQSASRFSRRTQEVVDGTMSLSAALMRAGEVAEANRLLEEVERDVATEEAVLFETVNEVKARGAISRSRITRLKLMKMLAAATMGASLFVFSAFSVAVASFLNETPTGPGSFAERDLARAFHDASALETVTIAGIDVQLTRSQAHLYGKLTRHSSDSERLERFLRSVLPPDLVREVNAALTMAAERAVAAADEKSSQVVSLASDLSSEVTTRIKTSARKTSTSEGTTEKERTEEPEDRGPTPNEGGGEVEPEDDDNVEGIPLPVDNPLGN